MRRPKTRRYTDLSRAIEKGLVALNQNALSWNGEPLFIDTAGNQITVEQYANAKKHFATAYVVGYTKLGNFVIACPFCQQLHQHGEGPGLRCGHCDGLDKTYYITDLPGVFVAEL